MKMPYGETSPMPLILGYHPKTQLRNATKWGLTKIYMIQTNLYFFEDEVEALGKKPILQGLADETSTSKSGHKLDRSQIRPNVPETMVEPPTLSGLSPLQRR